MKLTIDDVEILKSKKAPDLSYKIYFNLIIVLFSLSLLITYFVLSKEEIELRIFTFYHLHFLFPIFCYCLYFGITKFINRKIDYDISNGEKKVVTKKIKAIKYNRRFAYVLENRRRIPSGHSPEHLIVFDDNSQFETSRAADSFQVGDLVWVHVAMKSKLPLKIEKPNAMAQTTSI